MKRDLKSEQLGMPYGTAANRLRKEIMFSLVQKLGLDICHQCNHKIESSDKLSIEHMVPWLHSENPVDLYFDLDNISFSHTTCNYSSARHNSVVIGRSGFKGVIKRKERWTSMITYNGKLHHIGMFGTPEEAAKAYDEEAIKVFGIKAVTNKMMGLID